jgi:hypothetical protein
MILKLYIFTHFYRGYFPLKVKVPISSSIKITYIFFQKSAQNLKTSTPSYMVYGELGDTLYILILKSEPYVTGQDL